MFLKFAQGAFVNTDQIAYTSRGKAADGKSLRVHVIYSNGERDQFDNVEAEYLDAVLTAMVESDMKWMRDVDSLSQMQAKLRPAPKPREMPKVEPIEILDITKESCGF